MQPPSLCPGSFWVKLRSLSVAPEPYAFSEFFSLEKKSDEESWCVVVIVVLSFLYSWSFVFGSEPPGVVEMKAGFPSLVLIKLWCWPSPRAYIRVVLFRKNSDARSWRILWWPAVVRCSCMVVVECKCLLFTGCTVLVYSSEYARLRVLLPLAWVIYYWVLSFHYVLC